MLNNSFLSKMLDIFLIMIGTYNIQTGHPYIGAISIVFGAYCILYGHGKWEIVIHHQNTDEK